MSCEALTPTPASNVEEDKKPEFFSHIELKVQGQVRFSLFSHISILCVEFFNLCIFVLFGFHYCFDSSDQCNP